MKYIITKSQLDKVIFKYLDNQDFIQIKKEKYIYFVNSEGDKYAQIRYDKPAGWFRFDKSDGRCYIDVKLINEISTFFSLQESESKQFISRWVENALQMKVTNIVTANEWFVSELRIPD